MPTLISFNPHMLAHHFDEFMREQPDWSYDPDVMWGPQKHKCTADERLSILYNIADEQIGGLFDQWIREYDVPHELWLKVALEWMCD